MSFFKIGVDLNGMSASEYLPLYQSFTNRTHIRNGRRFDQSEISQIVEKNICCGVILSGFDTIKKFTSVYSNLLSENDEDWSNAVHSCRRILQDLA